MHTKDIRLQGVIISNSLLVYSLKGLLALVLIPTLLACSGEKKEEAKPAARTGPPPEFAAIVAQTVPLDRDIIAPGSIMPNESTDLHPEISGRVVSINFKEGSFVSSGALLVKIYDQDLRAQYNKLKVQLQVAEATERRQSELLAINGTSQQDYDNARLSVSNIKADLELLSVNLRRTEIRAPFSGKLGLRNISLGAYITPATVISNISQVSRMKVEFSVPEKYVTNIRNGKLVTMTMAGGSKVYNATVLASQNTVSEESRNLVVRAGVNNPDASLTPGSFVEVKVNVGEQRPTIMIPTQAVIPGTRYKNVIVSEGGKAVFRQVQTGYRDSANVEIMEGLKVGDTVITTGLLSLKDGMPVRAKVKS